MRASTRGRRLRSTPRPRDRRDQLAAIAADLFRRHGYHNVGVNDLAAAVGITGPAVYRHFPSKQAILGHVVLTGFDRFAEVIAAALDDAGEVSDERRLEVLAATVAEVVVRRRDLGALWRREGRNLPAEDRAELAARARRAGRFGAALIQRVRPELADADADLLCWAALSVYGSVSEHQVSLPRARFEALLTELARTVVTSTAVPAAAGPAPGGSPAPTDPAGPARRVERPRREQLLGLAARMFCEHGFHAVTMEDIGAAAGISGPSIYRHYDSKADLLLAMCARVGERLHAGMDAALGAGLDPPAALRALATSFVDTVLDHRDLVAAYLMEGDNLPDRDRAEVRRLQRAYLAQWVALLAGADPGTDDRSARVRVHAAFAVVNDLARASRFASRPHLADELVSLATAVLLPGSLEAAVPQLHHAPDEVDLLGVAGEGGELDQ